MIDSVLFIGTLIVAVVELIKYYVPRVRGPYTIIVAMAVGILVALIDTHIGVQDITVAQGILTGLSSAGGVAALSKISTGTPKPASTQTGLAGTQRR